MSNGTGQNKLEQWFSGQMYVCNCSADNSSCVTGEAVGSRKGEGSEWLVICCVTLFADRRR